MSIDENGETETLKASKPSMTNAGQIYVANNRHLRANERVGITVLLKIERNERVGIRVLLKIESIWSIAIQTKKI